MSDKPVLLSISMLVSGRGEMAKSLESIQPIRNAFPCEIILVDTGCNAEQRALAERYGDKVVDFPWCEDFAAARNAGLKEARGEWFMYLDDDEWFESTRDIVDFFVSGEYKDYNSASYAVRNYMNAQGTMYDESYPSRICRLEPESCFIGKVHEFLNTFKAPTKVFSDFAHHYGYVYRDEEEKKKHAERNIRPLLEMVEQYAEDPRWTGQLAQEYYTVGKLEEAYEVCRKWIEEEKEKSRVAPFAPTYVGCIYAFALISLHTLNRYEEEEKWLEKALADPLAKRPFMEPTVAFFNLVGVRLYGKTGQYEKCRDYMSKYMYSERRLRNNRQAVEAGADLIASGVFQENLLYGTVLMALESLIRMEDYELAEESFYALDWSDRRLLNQFDTERDVVYAMCSVPYHLLWVKILETLVSREDGMKEMLVAFLDAEIFYKKQGKQEELDRLRRLVAQLQYGHSYILCSKILWAEKDPDVASEEERRQRIEELFGRLFEEYPYEILNIKTEIWNVAERMEVPVGSLIKRVNFHDWRRSLEAWCRETDLADIRKWDARISSWKREPDVRFDLFDTRCREGYLHHYKEAAPDLAALEKLLFQYADSALALYSPYYRENVLTEAAEALPEELRLALRLRELKGYREQGDDLKALEAARRCLGLWYELWEVLGEYAGRLRDDVQRRNSEAEAARAALNRIVDSLKSTARLRIEREDYQTAKEILLQVRQCAPEDQETEQLLNQAEEGLN